MDIAINKMTSKNNLLKNRDFLLLYFGGLVSWLGNNIYYVALSWFILDKTHSSVNLATLMLLGSIPEIVFGPISGVLVDRIDRKKIIVFMDIIRGCIILGLVQVLNTQYFFPILLVGTFIMAVCDTFFSPAVSAAVPNIVEEQFLVQANAWVNFSGNFTRIVGLALGGVLVATIGVKGVFYLNGLSFWFSAISEIFIQIPLKKKVDINDKTDKNSFIKDLKEGIKFLFGQSSLMVICAIAILLNFFFVGSLGVGLPYIVKEVFHMGEVNFGLMEVFFPIGSVIGAIVLGFLPEVKKLLTCMFLGLSSLGGILLTMAVILMLVMSNIWSIDLSYWVIGGLIFLIGIINVVINVPVVTLFQKLVPDEFRGRFYGVFGTISQGLIPLAYFISGLILSFCPAYVLLMFGGVAILVLAFGITRLQALKQL